MSFKKCLKIHYLVSQPEMFRLGVFIIQNSVKHAVAIKSIPEEVTSSSSSWEGGICQTK